MNARSERFEHIDIAKGVAIILVVLCHSQLGNFTQALSDTIILVTMPLFFMLSGIFFSWDSTPTAFLIKKSDALLKPYLAVSFTALLFFYFTGDSDINWMFKGILYGNGDTINGYFTPLWFLTHLFIVIVFSYLLFKFANLHLLGNAVTVVLLLFISIGATHVDYFWYEEVVILSTNITIPGLPASTDLILITSSFFIAGRMLNGTLKHFKPNAALCLLAASLLFWIVFYTDAQLDLNKRRYIEPLYATSAALVGIYLILSISYWIAKSPQLARVKSVTLTLGQSTLTILALHQLIMMVFFNMISGHTLSVAPLLACSIISIGLGITLPVKIQKAIKRSEILAMIYLPLHPSNRLFVKASSINKMLGRGQRN